MSSTASPAALAQHAPQNAMDDPGEIARFDDRCSDLMHELLQALAAAPRGLMRVGSPGRSWGLT